MREHAQELDALVLAHLVEVLPVDARESDRVDERGVAGAGKLGDERQDVARRRVARGDIGEVHQAVADRIEGARGRRRVLGQHGELHPAVGHLLDLVGPALQHHARQVMLGRDPRGHGKGGGLGEGRRSGGEQPADRRGE